ncbi:MAG: mannitol dehydrogenase family protein, partial [Paracoccus sp. (in: a-proteobacteria)]
MKLIKEILNAPSVTRHNYLLPNYNIEEIVENTKKSPTWLHLGAGNIFRAFLASHHQHLLNDGLADTGIIVAEGYDEEIVDILGNYDNLTIDVTLKSNGEVEKEILGSITEYLKMDTTSQDFITLKEIFRNSTLQLVSLTITEKGYSLVDSQGNILPSIQEDFVNGPKNPNSYLGKLTTLLFERFQAGEYPLALVSMDNMSHNGEKLQAAITSYVNAWVEKGLVPKEFKNYIEEKNITFPWSMIDKITPRPSVTVEEMLIKDGFEDVTPITTVKNTYVAPYVNGEETEYLIIEDVFPNGRPPLEKTGIIFTDRETVNKVETMKVTTCLNPLHTALAVYGILLNHKTIADEM